MAPQINPADFTNLTLEAHENDVWVVTLNRPSKRNALDSATVEEMVEFFSIATESPI